MPYYSVNGIKIDPTVFSRRIFSPQNRSDSVLNRFCGYGTKIPFTLFSLFASFSTLQIREFRFFQWTSEARRRRQFGVPTVALPGSPVAGK